MTPLKEMFGRKWYALLAKQLSTEIGGFPDKKFLNACLAGNETRELNDRMRHTSTVLKNFLPVEFPVAVGLLKKIVPHLPRGYTNLVFPDFVGQYGIEHFEVSMDALRYFTGFGSSEFAIRQFLRHDFDRTIRLMYGWAKSPDHHVRRLASEGSRPALPWSFRLERVIKDPSVTAPILQALKSDEELYVRKSVANHLNDISKFDPDYMLRLVNGWSKDDPRTAWVIRHASRTLIKKGHAGSLAALSFEKDAKITLSDLRVNPSNLKIGGNLEISFTLESEKKRPQKLAVDYRVHYKKKNGTSIKTFKLRELDLGACEKRAFSKIQRFTDFSTRVHHPGRHLVEIQVNGKILASRSFILSH